MQLDNELMTTKVNKKLHSLIKDITENKGIDVNSYLLYKVAMVTVMVEEQTKTINQLTETLNKIIDNA